MKFYHSTRENVWAEIQKDGVLWGCPRLWDNYTGEDPEQVIGKKLSGKTSTDYRYTYLSPDLGWSHFGEVLLEVEYEPEGVGNRDENDKPIDNFGWDEEHTKDGYCWQFSVFKPIPLSNVKRVDVDELKAKFDRGDMYKNLNIVNKKIRNKVLIKNV